MTCIMLCVQLQGVSINCHNIFMALRPNLFVTVYRNTLYVIIYQSRQL